MLAKAKWSGGRVKDINDFKDESHIIEMDVGDYNIGEMPKFGINIVLARQIPFFIDGLKPVQRRAMVSIYREVKGGITTMPNAISSTMKIHPHGDASIYSDIVMMGQPWKMMACMIDSLDENYGSAKGFGDKEAAARYLKTKLSKYALDCFFSDYDEHIVEMHSTYDDNAMEPIYLPAKYPNLFINGASGMAWGYATNVPFYGISDILNYTIKLIEDPDKHYGTIIPESPTGCYIVDSPKVFEALQFDGYENNDTRAHTYKMRSVIVKDEEKHMLKVQSFPPQRTAEAFFKGVKEMKDNGVLAGCLSIEDYSQGEIIDIRLRFKSEANLDEARELLYSHKLGTESSFAAQVTVIDDMKVKRYSVKDCLLQWIAYRRDFKRRFYNMKIVQNKARVHALEQLIKMYSGDNAKKTIKIIQKADDREDAIAKLIEEYDIDSVQAIAVVDMRHWEHAKKVREKYKKELEDTKKQIDEWIELVTSTKKIDKKIIEELKEGIKKYGEPRRAKIITISDEKVIPDTNHTIVITANGCVKKLKDDVKSVGKIAKNDSPMEVKKDVNNFDSLIIFDSFGRVHTLPVSTIRSCDLASHGTPLSSYSKIDNSQVISVFVIDKEENLKHSLYKGGGYFLFTTKRGIIKKSPYEEYVGLRNSSMAIRLRTDDSLISVQYVNKDTDVVTFTYNGFGLRYNTDSVSETKRNSVGVKAFTVDEDDAVKDTTILSKKDTHLLIITIKGYAKKIRLDILNTAERRSDSRILSGLREGDLMMYARGVQDSDSYSAIMKEGHVEFNIGNDVPEQFKLGKGSKLIPVKRGDVIIKLVKIK